jgi:hypothetical protein
MTGPQPKSHEIDLKTAAEMTARHRSQVTIQGAKKAGDGDLGGLFTKEAVIKLLENPNARYLRFYYGRNAQGGRELVLAAADGAGNDLIGDQGVGTLDGHFPCPPWCPTSASTLRG